MSTVIYEKKDHIAYVRLNRPEALNAINNEMRRELETVWHDFNADDDLWVAILTAEGDRAFSSGADLRERAYVTGEKEDPRPIHTLGHGINVYKPIVCGIHGYCLAAGLDVALACDIRVAAEDASIGMTMTRWGVMAATGATQLPRTIGWTKAMEMLLTAERITAQEALDIGLVNKVVPREQLMETCEAYAATIMKNSPTAVRLTKEAALRGIDTSKAASLDIGTQLQQINRTSEDAKEGPKAFAEKRQPEWKGR